LTICAFFSLLQVAVTFTDGVRRQRRRRRSRSTVLLPSSAAARGATRRYCFCSFRGLPGTVPEFFGVHFVNLKLFNVLFGLF